MAPPSDSESAYDVFISHCKKADGTEDRALWCVDVFEEAGMRPFFDLQHLEEISSEQLVKDVKASKAVVTVCIHSPCRCPNAAAAPMLPPHHHFIVSALCHA